MTVFTITFLMFFTFNAKKSAYQVALQLFVLNSIFIGIRQKQLHHFFLFFIQFYAFCIVQIFCSKINFFFAFSSSENGSIIVWVGCNTCRHVWLENYRLTGFSDLQLTTRPADISPIYPLESAE